MSEKYSKQKGEFCECIKQKQIKVVTEAKQRIYQKKNVQ